MSFLTLRDPETSAKAHRALVMHYPQGGKTSEELMQQAFQRTHVASGIGMRLFEPEDIDDMRARYAAGETQQAIADDYGVTRDTIGHIIQGESYTDVPESEAAA